jgi:hypothetical protein
VDAAAGGDRPGGQRRRGQRGGCGTGAVHPGGTVGSERAGPCAGERAVGDGVHEVPVQAHGDGGPGVSHADLVLLPADHHMAVALDLAVDLDGLRGGEHGAPVTALDRGLRRGRPGLPGTAHRQEGQVLG